MQTQAAVLFDYGRDWEVEELTLDDPEGGRGAGPASPPPACATPTSTCVTGDLPMAALPAIGGHEGAGVVDEVGAGRHAASAEGDHVVLGFIPVVRPVPARAPRPRRTCATSARHPASAVAAPTAPPATTRAARTLGPMCCSARSRPYTVVHEASVRQDRRRHPARQGRRSSAAASPPAGARGLRRRGQRRRDRRRDRASAASA